MEYDKKHIPQLRNVQEATRHTSALYKQYRTIASSNMSAVVDTYTRAGWFALHHVMDRGGLPIKPPTAKQLEHYDSRMRTKLALRQSDSAKKGLKTPGVKQYPTPHMALIHCEWHASWSHQLMLSTEQSSAALTAMCNIIRSVERHDLVEQGIVPTKGDTLELIKTSTTLTNQTPAVLHGFSNVAKNVSTMPTSLQGGGTGSKEGTILRGEPVENFGAAGPTKKCVNVIAINSQNRPEALRGEDLFAATGATMAIVVAPNAHDDSAEADWASTDDPGYLKPTVPMEAVRINDRQVVQLQIKKLKCTAKDHPGYYDGVLAFTTGHATTKESGACVVKPKYDGTMHYLRVVRGKAMLWPRSIDETVNLDGSHTAMPYRICHLEFDHPIDLEAGLELVSTSAGLKWHVVRLASMNGWAFSPKAAFCRALEHAIGRIDGIPMCQDDECKCPRDGLLLETLNGEHYLKPRVTLDIKTSTNAQYIFFDEIECSFKDGRRMSRIKRKRRMTHKAATNKRFHLPSQTTNHILTMQALGLDHVWRRCEYTDLAITFDVSRGMTAVLGGCECGQGDVIMRCTHGSFCGNCKCLGKHD